MRKTMNICGEEFVVLKSMSESDFTRCIGTPCGCYSSIYTAYSRPSKAKISIWEYWNNWLKDVWKECPVGKMWIASRNAFMFTISGIIEFENGERYEFYITKTRQEIFKLA